MWSAGILPAEKYSDVERGHPACRKYSSALRPVERGHLACTTFSASPKYDPGKMDEHRGWFSRGYLPHLDVGEITQFITFRLGDSLPQEALAELECLRDKEVQGNFERYEKAEFYLDQGHGSCILQRAACAKIVQDALIFLHGKRYELIAWVIMPNHVHLMARFEQGQSVSKAMHSLKSFTANEINKVRSSSGPVWQAESFDRFIRGEEHFNWTLRYIHENPVVAKLCQSPELFPWSSASGSWQA